MRSVRPFFRNVFYPVIGCVVMLQSAFAIENRECLECHGEADGVHIAVNPDSINASVHEGFLCIDCHDSIADADHTADLPPANCAGCHSEVAEIYTRHGQADVGSPRVPTCASCHGGHDIRPVQDTESRVHPHNLPTTCGSCHEDQSLLDEFDIRFKHPVRMFESSVHGRADLGSLDTAASCNDCHATGGSSHRILSPGDSASSINYFNIPSTCGQCHGEIEKEYRTGVHGRLAASGEVDAPTCTRCHGEHSILNTDDPRSPVSSNRLAESICAPCHEAAFLNEKYELPSGRLQSYVDSYHGLKSKAGDKAVANCASCHEAHHILPASDPESSINPGNLQHTCGTCHEGITAEIASVPIHDSANGARTGLSHIVQVFYRCLIFLVIGVMALHWLLDLGRQIREVLARNSVRRMTAHEVIQHGVLALSFTVLVISGFSLRFHEAWWSKLVFGHEGGFQLRGIAHRIAGVILLLGAVWHVCYLCTARGRAFSREMRFQRLDLKHFLQTTKVNLGYSNEQPALGRFSYFEKAEYWAVIWGTAIMGITGILLWIENLAVRIFPRGILEVCLVIHYYEAWLAFLAILVCHMYATVFNPKVYPMNPSWINGKMPRRMFREAHPAAHVEEVKKD